MFLEQMKKLIRSSSFRFTFYVMGSSWLIFTLVLIILYQIARVILYETSILESQDVRKIEDILYKAEQYVSPLEMEQEVRKAIDSSNHPEQFKLQIINREEYRSGYYPSEKDLEAYGSLLENYEQSLFESFLIMFTLPGFYEIELPLGDTKVILITIDDTQFQKAEKTLKSALIACLSFTFVLLLMAMFYYTRRTVNRINDINQTCDTIIQGDLGKRVPITLRNDDYDSLAKNINIMLDKIQDLLQGVQQVSDNIAHDLRTPLTHFRNKLEHLNCNENDKHNLISHADDILSLFNSILSITKLEFKTIDVPKNPVKINTLLNDLIDLYEPIAEEKNITLHTNFISYCVHANKDLMFQAFSNLIENAIKYSRCNGEISITIEKQTDTSSILTILDSGEGIPEQEQKSVFRRMYRLEKHRGSPGNGLGLTMAKAIFDHHGWEIKLHNMDVGLKVEIHIPNTSLSTSV